MAWGRRRSRSIASAVVAQLSSTHTRELLRVLPRSKAQLRQDLFVLSQLDTLVAQLAERVKTMQIGNVQIIDSGDGRAFSAVAATYPAAVISVLGTLKDLTGVDVAGILANSAAALPVAQSSGGEA